MTGSTARRATLTVFLLALGVRLAYLYESSSSPTFHSPLVDASTYDRLARALAAGQGLTDEIFWQPLFYPLYLSAVYFLSGSSIIAARVLQGVVGAVTCALMERLGTRVAGARTGLLAGLMGAFYGPLVFDDAELLPTGWACFWSVALVLALLRVRGRHPAEHLLLGAGFALAVLTRPTFLPFALAASLWLALTPDWRATGLRVGALGAGFLLLAVPAALLSGKVSGRTSMLPASGAINLYIGNNPESAHTLAIRPGWEWENLTRMPRHYGVTQKRDTPAFFRQRVLEYVRDEPFGFVRGLLRKSAELASSRELPRNVDIYIYRDWSIILRTLVWKVGPFGFPFGLLLPLAVIGFVFARPRMPSVLVLFLALQAMAIVLVFVSSRYRAEIVPVLVVPAAAGVWALVERGRGSWRRLLLPCACALPAVLLSCLPGPFPQERAHYRAEMRYLLGRNAVDRGERQAALESLERAVELDPRHADAHTALGTLLQGLGQPARALEHFEAALDSNPAHAIAHANLARLLAKRRNHAGAERHLRLALEADPYDADLHKDLATVLSWQLRIDEALEHFSRALEIRPADADLHYRWGRVLESQGRLADAERHLLVALDLDELHRDACDALASVLIRQGRRDEARARYRTALERAEGAGRPELAEHFRKRLAAS